MSRTIHQKRKHPEYVAGCFGCKISTVSFGTVPGGAKDSRTKISFGRETEHNLRRYEERKAAGEKPSGTTRRAREKDAYKQHLWEKHGPSIEDENPTETVKSVKKSLLNE